MLLRSATATAQLCARVGAASQSPSGSMQHTDPKLSNINCETVVKEA